MNFSFLSLADAWQLLGWTMILFLVAGTAVLLIGGALRVILKRANPIVRYCASLAVFVVLALLPLAIAGYLMASLPRQWEESTDPTRQRGELTTNLTNSTNQELNAEHAKSAEFAEANALTNPTRQGGEDFATNLTRQPGESSNAVPPVNAVEFDFSSLLNQSVSYLPWLWCIGTPLTFLLLATGLIGAERLRSSCQLLNDGPIHAACNELRAALGISRQVGVAVCERIATPLLVGVVKPLILLPTVALNGWTTAELEMVFVHELAHVRRWDNAVNLIQRIVESLLFFHPAVWIVSGWVRRDREDCCDATVVRHTAKPQAYAELLLALASTAPRLATSAALARHPVASRIRRILKLEDEPMLITRKGLFAGVSAAVVAVLLAFTLPTTDAEETVSRDSKFSREAERVADERASDERVETTNQEEKELTTESTEAAKKQQKVNDESVQYSVVYALGDNEAELRSWLEAIGEFSDRINLFVKDGKQMAVVTGTRAGHKKLSAMLESVRRENSAGTVTIKPNGKANSPFPTLEEQLAADLAYKLLGVELEKITPQELERAKAKGYEGGLRVMNAMGIDMGRGVPPSPLMNGDILVGLHVWPTESLTQVQEILTRFDLNELSPLKFYVIRQSQLVGGYGMDAGGAMMDPAAVGALPDEVITGRIAVDLTAWAEKEGFKQGRLKQSQPVNDAGTSSPPPVPQNAESTRPALRHPDPPPGSADQPNPFGGETDLFYDGKTFDEWRSLWKSELKTEKRIECIKALAAFGRAGKGKEAAEAILDVAAEYDFAPPPDGFGGDDSPEGKLKERIMEELTDYPKHLSERDWLPALKERLAKEPEKYRGLTSQMLPRLYTTDPTVKPILSELQQSDDQTVRQAALSTINSSQGVYTDDEKNELIKTALAEEPVTAIRVLGQWLLNYVSVEQAVEFLLSDDADVQLAARRAVNRVYDKEKGAQLTKDLVTLLNDESRQQDNLATVRALATLRYFSHVAEPALTKILETTDDEELMIAAMYAREFATLGRNHSRMAISDDTKKAIQKSNRWQKYLDDKSLLHEAFNSEASRVYGTQSPMGGMGGGLGGMGGMGGGGMF